MKSDLRCRRIALWLFIGLSGFFLAGSTGYILNPDGTIMFGLTQRLMAGHLDLNPLGQWKSFGGVEVTDPVTGNRRFFSKFGPGLSVAAIPAYLTGKLLLPLARKSEQTIFVINKVFKAVGPGPGSGPKNMVSRQVWYDTQPRNFSEAFLAFAVSWTNALVTAGLLAGVFLFVTALGYRLTPSVLFTVTLALATPLWHYSREFFSEPLSGFGLVWFLVFAIHAKQAPDQRRYWIFAGAALGISVLSKALHGLLIIPAFVLCATYAFQKLNVRTALIRLIQFGLTLGAGLILLGTYNFVRFHSVFKTGYAGEIKMWTTPFLKGFMGLLISPGRGLVWYCPLVILAMVSTWRFARKHLPEILFIWTSFFILLLIYSKWHMWEGGWCWGPRFLIPVLPLILLPVVTVFETPPKRWFGRTMAVLLILASLLVAVSGVMVSYNEYAVWVNFTYMRHSDFFVQGGYRTNYDLMAWNWYYAPIIRYWQFPLKDCFLFVRAIQFPGLILGILVTAALVALTGAVQLIRWVRPSIDKPVGGC